MSYCIYFQQKMLCSLLVKFEMSGVYNVGFFCLFFFFTGCKPEQHMMYAGSKLDLVKETGLTKVGEHDVSYPCNHGEHDASYPCNHGEHDASYPCDHGEDDASYPCNHG